MAIAIWHSNGNWNNNNEAKTGDICINASKVILYSLENQIWYETELNEI